MSGCSAAFAVIFDLRNLFVVGIGEHFQHWLPAEVRVYIFIQRQNIVGASYA